MSALEARGRARTADRLVAGVQRAAGLLRALGDELDGPVPGAPRDAERALSLLSELVGQTARNAVLIGGAP
jgi:hypothetical protein